MPTVTRKIDQNETATYAVDGTWAIYVRRFWGQIDRVRVFMDREEDAEANAAFRALVKRMARGFFGLSIVHERRYPGKLHMVAMPCNVDPTLEYNAAKYEGAEVFLEELHSRTGRTYLAEHWVCGEGELGGEHGHWRRR